MRFLKHGCSFSGGIRGAQELCRGARRFQVQTLSSNGPHELNDPKSRNPQWRRNGILVRVVRHAESTGLPTPTGKRAVRLSKLRAPRPAPLLHRPAWGKTSTPDSTHKRAYVGGQATSQAWLRVEVRPCIGALASVLAHSWAAFLYRRYGSARHWGQARGEIEELLERLIEAVKFVFAQLIG